MFKKGDKVQNSLYGKGKVYHIGNKGEVLLEFTSIDEYSKCNQAGFGVDNLSGGYTSYDHDVKHYTFKIV